VLSRLADDEIRNVAIVREVQQLITRHRRILVFAATVGHALLLATVLRALGVAAQAVSGATPSPERSRLISWYKDAADEPRVLANYGVLTTGFDAPSTSAAVIARPTKSLVLFSQMVGRTTRGIKAGGNLEAEVVTVVDTALPGFGDLTTAFTNWEDVW
jgi:superfamily II DNA or RNA helicase